MLGFQAQGSVLKVQGVAHRVSSAGYAGLRVQSVGRRF